MLNIFQVSLLTENGNTKDDLRLPTDDNLLSQVSLCDMHIFLSQSLFFNLLIYFSLSNFSHFLLSQIKDGFAEGKDLVVSVMNAMGEEQICALKDIGPKN